MFTFIASVFASYLIIRSVKVKLQAKTERLQTKIEHLQLRVSLLESKNTNSDKLTTPESIKNFTEEVTREHIPTPVETKEDPYAPYHPPAKTTTLKQDFQSFKTDAETLINAPVEKENDIQKGVEAPQSPSFFAQIEEQIAGNWTGVLGTLAIVVGVAFLGIYAALKMGPMGRTAMIMLISIGMWCTYILLNKKEFWKNLSLWIRAASGVVFLIACVGASSFEATRWVNEPIVGILLFVLGIGVNLWLGQSSGSQRFASLHACMVFIFLALAPLNPVTFALASITGVLTLLMSYGDRKWDLHTFVVSGSYFVLNLYWYAISDWSGGSIAAPVAHELAILCHLAVGVTGLLLHYRKIYAEIEENSLSLQAHLFLWATLGINLYMHSQGSKFTTFFLALGAVSVYTLSKTAFEKKINWLFTVDRCMSLVIGLVAILSLTRWGISYNESALISLPIVALFIYINAEFKNNSISFIGSLLLACIWCSATLTHLVDIINLHHNISDLIFWRKTTFLISSSLLLLIFYKRFNKYQISAEDQTLWDKIPETLTSLSISLLPLLCLIMLPIAAEYEVKMGLCYILFFAIILLRPYMHSTIFSQSFFTSFVLFLILIIFHVSSVDAQGANPLIHSILWIFAGTIIYMNAYFDELKQRLLWWPISIFFGSAMATCYFFVREISPLTTGICWLLLAGFCLLLKNIPIFQKESATGNPHENAPLFLVWTGVGILVAFFVRHFLVDIQTQIYWGPVMATQAIAVFSLGVLYFYYLEAREKLIDAHSTTKAFLESIVEFSFILITALCMVHFDANYFGFIALILCFISFIFSKQIARLKILSYIFWIFSLFHLGFVSSSAQMPTIHWQNETWVINLIILAGQCVFFTAFFRERKKLQETVSYSGISNIYSGLQAPLSEKTAKWLVFPIFFAVAAFLYWSFDKSWLSVLWTILCMGLLVFSLVLREALFRIFAMCGVGVIVIRLIFFDLQDQDFFVKAIVFIAVGAILVAMNTLYTRFKTRYSDKEENL